MAMTTMIIPADWYTSSNAYPRSKRDSFIARKVSNYCQRNTLVPFFFWYLCKDGEEESDSGGHAVDTIKADWKWNLKICHNSDSRNFRFLGHNMSQTDANSTGGESARGGYVGHTGTGCYKNHEHSMLHGTAAASGPAHHNRSALHTRRPSAVATATGAVSIAAVTALLTSSPATNVSGHPMIQPPTNNLVDLGKNVVNKIIISKN